MRVKKESLKFLYGVFAAIAFFIIAAEPETVKAEESPYYIKVNRQQNVVTIYEQDDDGEYSVPVKAMTCSTGANNATPTGTFDLSMKYRWHELDGKVYGQYCSRITGHILFHSVYYNDTDPGSLAYNGYNRLGTQASHGCVRLSVADSKWIYDNCPSGTVVTIYDDKDNPGPLGKPSTIKIDTSSPYRGWDPTDPDENNPWSKSAPEIKGAKDKTVELGSEKPNWTKNVTAVDYKGNELEVNVTDNCDMEKAGTYEVTFTAEDELGNTAEKKITVTVEDTQAPVIENKKDTITITDVSEKEKLEKQLKENVSAKDNGKKLSSEYITLEADQLVNAIQEKKYGIYEVKAYAADASGNKSDAVTFYVKYADTSQEQTADTEPEENDTEKRDSSQNGEKQQVPKNPVTKDMNGQTDTGQDAGKQNAPDLYAMEDDTGGLTDTGQNQKELSIQVKNSENKNNSAEPRGSTEFDDSGQKYQTEQIRS